MVRSGKAKLAKKTHAERIENETFQGANDDLFDQMVQKSTALLNKRDAPPLSAPNDAPRVRKSYVASEATNNIETPPSGKSDAVDSDRNLDVEESFSSQTTMVLPYIGYNWEDFHNVRYTAISINLPSGLIHEESPSLEGKILPSLIEGSTKLLLKCQWPDCLSDESILIQGVQHMAMCDKHSIINFISGFRKHQALLRKTTGASTLASTGSNIIMPLPNTIESIAGMCPVQCANTGGFNVIIMLKHKKQELHEKVLNYTFKMVRTSSDINAVLQKKPTTRIIPTEDQY